jgi:hypothetical protein
VTRIRFLVILTLSLGYALTAASTVSAQAVEYSCKYFSKSVFQATDCMEALFSEDMPYLHGHLAMGSVPPGNGFALGVVIEKPTHFVSPFAPQVPPDMRDKDLFQPPADPDTKEKADRGGYKSLFVPKLGAAVSTNGSWIISGTGDWLPGIYKYGIRSEKPPRPGLPPIKKPCHKFLFSCTESVLAVHLNGTHRVARTVSFYGLGPATPDVKYVFRLDETYGGVQARLPLVNAFILSGGVEGRYPVLPTESGANSVTGNFPPSALSGLNAQPTYVHSNAGFILRARHLFEPTIKVDHETGPLYLVNRDAITPEAEFAYHWYKAGSSSAASFQQLVASANLSIELGATTEGYVVSTDVKGFWRRTYYRVLQHYCGGPPASPRILVDPKADAKQRDAEKKRQEAVWKARGYVFEIKHDSLCDFGTLEFRSHLVTTSADNNNVIPFYMLPTLGGQDIDSRVSLRGFENYRFRAPDTMFVQAEYSLPVYDPFALLLFYDAGNVGNTLGDLSFAHLRQDGGFGINIRVMRMTLAQVYLAGGRGGGLHPGFNLAKQF